MSKVKPKHIHYIKKIPVKTGPTVELYAVLFRYPEYDYRTIDDNIMILGLVDMNQRYRGKYYETIEDIVNEGAMYDAINLYVGLCVLDASDYIVGKLTECE